MSGFDIRDLRKKHAEQYAKVKEQEENEKKQQEELKRIETEQKMLHEIAYKNDFEDFINQLDTILVDVHSCHNILEMDLYVEAFKHQLEQNSKFLETEYCHQEIIQKMTDLINCVSQNSNSKFDITVKDSNTEAANRITNTIKQIMNLCKLNENNVNIELMDTSNDEEIAKKLHQENIDNQENIDYQENLDNQENQYDDDMEFHKFIPIHQRTMDDNLPDLMDDNEFTPIDVPSIPIPGPNSITNPKPAVANPEYYIGFDAIEDPELIQLAYFQNELMDD